MALVVPSITSFIPHHLHDTGRSWPETNCYVDLFIEVLAFLGMIPEACFGFAIEQDFGIDQFTFSKPPLPDLEFLYGLKVRELSLYKSLEHHVELHLKQGHLVILEVDAFYLPDTYATTYQQDHSKTTIAVDYLDLKNERCFYFHNAARGELLGRDYLGAFQLNPDHARCADMMFPYVEVIERLPSWEPHDKLQAAAVELLEKHFKRRPQRNPFEAWRQVYGEHLDTLLTQHSSFHDYAFHFPRLAGSNFETFSSHIEWLAQGQFEQAAAACKVIAKATKTLQYRLARSVARGKVDLADDCFDLMEASYSKVIDVLGRYFS